MWGQPVKDPMHRFLFTMSSRLFLRIWNMRFLRWSRVTRSLFLRLIAWLSTLPESPFEHKMLEGEWNEELDEQNVVTIVSLEDLALGSVAPGLVRLVGLLEYARVVCDLVHSASLVCSLWNSDRKFALAFLFENYFILLLLHALSLLIRARLSPCACRNVNLVLQRSAYVRSLSRVSRNNLRENLTARAVDLVYRHCSKYVKQRRTNDAVKPLTFTIQSHQKIGLLEFFY